ncbi:hypothetical protein [Ferruginibacter sp.]|nr:hypothetical protein [Ferruginibacter sp.]
MPPLKAQPVLESVAILRPVFSIFPPVPNPPKAAIFAALKTDEQGNEEY